MPQEWYHGRIEAFKPTGEKVQNSVPFNSISVSWIRNHLAEKATELVRRVGFRVKPKQRDPNTIELLHPTQEVVSVRMTTSRCRLDNPDCEGGCLADDNEDGGTQ